MERIKLEKPDGFYGEQIYVIPQQNLIELRINPLLRGFIVTDAGYFPHASGHYRKRERGCGQTICLFCTNGRGEVNIDNTPYTLEQGQALVIQQGLAHSYAADLKNPWTLYWLHVSGDFVLNYIPQSHQNIPVSIIGFETPSAPSKPVELFHSMFSYLSNGYSIGHILAASSIGASIISQVFTNHPNISGTLSGSIVRQLQPALNYIQGHLSLSMDVAKLSRLCGLSNSKFTYLFSQCTGLSPMNYVSHQRIQRACHYLEATSESIAVIAELVGYEDQFYFSRIFRKITGMSPRQYRKHH